MATRSKSSGGKARRKSSTAKRATGKRAATKTKRSGGPRVAAKPKIAAKKKSSRGSAASKRNTKRSAKKKQSPVTRIKRVATSVLHQGATAAKQGVQAVERLVEEVKDRVVT